MDGMQEKLEQYRVRKRRKERFEEFKGSIRRFLMLGTGISLEEQLKRENHVIDVDEDVTPESKKLLPADLEHISEDDISSSDNEQKIEQREAVTGINDSEADKQNKLFKYTLWTVYLLFWGTLYIIAIELKFGIVFLMLSALFGIYFNTRTGPKKKNEISAYSVFNKNCESIDGTLKAEQFEREMRYGAGSVR